MTSIENNLAEKAFELLDRSGFGAHENCEAFRSFYNENAADGYDCDGQWWCHYYVFKDGSVLDQWIGEWRVTP